MGHSDDDPFREEEVLSDGCVGGVVRTALLTQSPQIQKPPRDRDDGGGGRDGASGRGGRRGGIVGVEWWGR